jgi:hypothetical protein
MQDERVIELNVGCHPAAGVSSAILIQPENADSVVLCFRTVASNKTTAVVEFLNCQLTRFGYPNDEGLPEHPLYSKGLARAMYSVCEVLNSSWAAMERDRQRNSALRIRGDASWVKTDRHFLVSLHDGTFECLADDLNVREYNEPFSEVVLQITKRLVNE